MIASVSTESPKRCTRARIMVAASSPPATAGTPSASPMTPDSVTSGSLGCTVSGVRSTRPRMRSNLSCTSAVKYGRGSVASMRRPDTATVAPEARYANEPSPMRLWKLRFCDEYQVSPRAALRLATPRHIEQPGGSTTKPARS
jgi:hypothetical protein